MTSLPVSTVSRLSVSVSMSRRSGVAFALRGGKKSVFIVDDVSSLSEITESSNMSFCDSVISSFGGLGCVKVIIGERVSEAGCDA